MPAVALTDHGNMMGAFHFVKEIRNYNKGLKQQKLDAEAKGEPFEATPIKAIVGCEFFVCEDHKINHTKTMDIKLSFWPNPKKGMKIW